MWPPEQIPLSGKFPEAFDPCAAALAGLFQGNGPGFDERRERGVQRVEARLYKWHVPAIECAAREHVRHPSQPSHAVYDDAPASKALEAVAVITAGDALVDDDVRTPLRRQRLA